MGIHWIGDHGNVMVRLSATPHFVADAAHDAEGAWVACPGQGPKERGDCEGCTRFRGWHHDAGGQLRVQCSWTDRDPVTACMTPAVDVVTISPETQCAEAARVLEKNRVHHLPVLRSGALVAVVCGCDIHRAASPDLPISEIMSDEVLALGGDASIGEALAGMELCKIHFLPVIADGLLVGVVSRGDLERIGAPQGARACATSACTSAR